jgi:hypothetical protein
MTQHHEEVMYHDKQNTIPNVICILIEGSARATVTGIPRRRPELVDVAFYTRLYYSAHCTLL